MSFHFHGDKKAYILYFEGTKEECEHFKSKQKSNCMGFVEDIDVLQEGATTYSSGK